jgi:antitoxin (DNA-binding transcriptional repressor) of toxin-antitoxin stability system
MTPSPDAGPARVLVPIDQVATSGYIPIMREIKTVGIKALKDNLSSYLRDVRAGALILVTDRGSVVAEIRKPEIGNLVYEENSLMKQWIDEGWLIPARKRKSPCEESGVQLKKGTAAYLLDQDRGE